MSMGISSGLIVLLLAPVGQDSVDFPSQIQPILNRNCVICHGPSKQRGGLRLDTGSHLLSGGNSGPAVTAGKSGTSLLIKAIQGDAGVALMPPRTERLSPDEITLFRKWIDAGAKIPLDKPIKGDTEKLTRSDHWSFAPIGHPKVPQVNQSNWVRNPIDAFILARLEKERIQPGSEADRYTLIRRLSLDLLGLLPTVQEIEAFVKDPHPRAYENLVDRLLASPHYGERWGRHWLDIARYADTNGYSIDGPRQIWKYRDWVINSLNRDLPFDQLTIEQLAGDLLPGATTDQIIATGFHRNTQLNQEGGIDPEQFRIESIVDRVNTTATAFLGLTISCAQCHDHKFDPISQREYYRLFAFFNSVDEPTLELGPPEILRKRQEILNQLKRLKKDQKAIDENLQIRLEKWEGSLTPEDRKALPESIQAILAIAVNGRNQQQEKALLEMFRTVDAIGPLVITLNQPFPFLINLHLITTRLRLDSAIATATASLPSVSTTLVVKERTKPRSTRILLGGDFTRPGVEVIPGTPAVLPELPQKESLNRLDLARWLVDGRNPLTARVMMNRVWQGYFGLGLVETENDFGTQGTLPSHPDLLDWLARDFQEQKWSLKAMHRRIVTSATYRQSSKARPELKTIDPRNRLLARQNRLRLDAEVVRDVALTASGLLNDRVGGPGVYPPQPAGVYRFTQIPREWPESKGSDRYRRGMYIYLQRSALHPALSVFDEPDASVTCTRRNRSNTPLQALTLLNDQGFFEFAQALARRILVENSGNDLHRLHFAVQLCLGRPAQDRELKILEALLSRERLAFQQNPSEAKRLISANPVPIAGVDWTEFAAWTAVARTLLNLDEFITRE